MDPTEPSFAQDWIRTFGRVAREALSGVVSPDIPER